MPKTVWIYENGDIIKTFATSDEANAWFEIHDPEGVAFEHELSDEMPPGSADLYGVPRAKE